MSKWSLATFLRIFFLLFQLKLITYSTRIHPESQYLLTAHRVDLLHQKTPVRLLLRVAVTGPVCCSENAHTHVLNST